VVGQQGSFSGDGGAEFACCCLHGLDFVALLVSEIIRSDDQLKVKIK